MVFQKSILILYIYIIRILIDLDIFRAFIVKCLKYIKTRLYLSCHCVFPHE